MKNLKSLLTLIVFFLASSCAFASSTARIESYAHPTLFGTDVQQLVNDNQNIYVIGETIIKTDDQISVKGKNGVLIDSWAKDILALLKANATGVFNPKMPILRSEMAVVLAEGLSIKAVKPKYQYKDIPQNYWAKSWIDKALSEGVMIGYPDKNFRPDQPITKAEVFATLAQLIEVPTDKSLVIPDLKGCKMQNIPRWAIAPTKEVMASKLMEEIPDPEKAAKSKYLSKEQVAYLVGALRQSYAYDSKCGCKKYAPTYLKVEMTERIDSRHSNIGDTFYAKTEECSTVMGKNFPEGSIVKGEVVMVSRPGLDKPGLIKVKFLTIKNGDCQVKFPNTITDVSAKEINNVNPIARIVGAPFSTAGRILGVAGRTGAASVNVAANSSERYGDDISNTFVNTFSLEPKSGVRSFGKSFVTVGKFVYDLSKLAVSGTFGVVYEVGDEIRYLILPCSTNSSALNPGDELVIIY